MSSRALFASSLVALITSACAEPAEPDSTPDDDDDGWIEAAADDNPDPNEQPDLAVDVPDEPIDEAAELAADVQDELAARPALDVLDDGLFADSDDDPDAEDDDGDDDPDVADDPAPPDLAASIPSKIKYVLVIVKENHTFDNYFTGFPGATSSTHAEKLDKKTGKRIRFLRPFAPRDELASGPGHSHRTALAAYRNGHMDGFSVNRGKTPYIRFTHDQLPAYWKYASEFVLADHVFSESLGPSSPGHEAFWFARSTTLDNPKCHLPGGKGCGHGCLGNHLTATAIHPVSGKTRTVAPCFDLPSIVDDLPPRATWFNYGGPFAQQIKSLQHVSVSAHYGSTPRLLRDMRAGKLHNLMIAHIDGGDFSEHPPQGPCVGERFTVDVVNAAMQLPEWKEMAIIVTWDDWGGFYDHVKPPVRTSRNGARFGSGFRLPLIIISPYAKKGFVLKTPAEQASVPRLVEELWKMPFMSKRNAHARDGRAGSLLDAFDFTQTPRPPVMVKRGSCPSDP